MNGNKKISLIAVLAALASSTALHAAESNIDYPTKPLQFLVAAGPGGGTDIFARTVQPMLEDILGTNIIITNLGASAGAMAHHRTANSTPDGHVLDFASSNFITTLAAGQNEIGLDQITPVARVQYDVMAIMVDPERHPDFDSFMKYAEENPGKVTVGGTQANSPDQMAFLSLRKESNLDMNFIPFDNTGSATAGVLGGNINATATALSPLISYVEADRLKPILIFSDEPLDQFPDVPTTADYGWDLTDGNERGVFVNVNTSAEIVAKLEAALKEVHDSEEYRNYEENSNLHYRDGWMGSDEYRERLKENYSRYMELLK